MIYKSPHKKDKVDARKLCRLLRLGELKHIYHPENDARAIFKSAAQHYIDLRYQLVKLKIKATYRHWGIINIFTDSVYSIDGRDKYLEQVKHIPIRSQISRLYLLMNQTEAMRKSAFKAMKNLEREYHEIGEFKKIPGIADISSHIFDAFIQNTHRFAHKNRLWEYCRLSITNRSSEGKQLGFQRIDKKSGIGELKSLSYRAFMSAMKGDNEVKRFYLSSLEP